MARLFYLHWHKEECLKTVKQLRAAGHTVRFDHESGEEAWKVLKQSPPDLLVISLDRLPSHGRRVAAVTGQTKKLRDVPVVFVGGEPDKIEVAKRDFPHHVFCDTDALVATVHQMTSEEARSPASK
jgi:CheY-like chemotaxis protein